MRLFRPLLLPAVYAGLLCIAAPGKGFAQVDKTDKPIDLKPLVPPLVRPVLPPNAVLTPGGVGGDPPPHSAPPTAADPAPSSAPGIRLTIPTR